MAVPLTLLGAARQSVGAVLVTLALASVATGCVGQLGRNDDHVGPTSPRPDAREHTMAPTTTDRLP